MFTFVNMFTSIYIMTYYAAYVNYGGNFVNK